MGLTAAARRAGANWRVDARHAALLIHDMQRYFLRGYESAEFVERLVGRIARLREQCDALGIPVYYTAQPGDQRPEDRGPGCREFGNALEAATRADDARPDEPLTQTETLPPRPDATGLGTTSEFVHFIRQRNVQDVTIDTGLTRLDVMPTIRCEFHRLRASIVTPPRREVGSSVFQVFEGAGSVVLDGKETKLEKGDIFVVPSWVAW